MSFRRVGSTGEFEGYNSRAFQKQATVPTNEYSDMFAGPSMDDMEDVVDEKNDEIQPNDAGYCSMTPEQAIKQAKAKLHAYGIQTESFDHYEEPSESHTELVALLEQALSFEDPLRDNYMAVQQMKREDAHYRMKTEGFRIPKMKVYGEAPNYRMPPIVK